MEYRPDAQNTVYALFTYAKNW